MKMKMLSPSLSGKGATSVATITVDGDIIKYSKSAQEQIGLTAKESKVWFFTGDEEGKGNRMYILNESEAQAQASENEIELNAGWKVNGDVGKNRYTKDADVVKAHKLGSGKLALLKSKEGSYIEWNPKNPTPVITVKARPTSKKNDAGGEETNGKTEKGKKAQTV